MSGPNPEFERKLTHVLEQAEKNQWWNVTATLNQAQAEALKTLDRILKGKP